MRVLTLFFLLLTACQRGPAVPTAAENRELDEAANLLDSADNALPGTDENELAPAEPANTVTP